jgi:hypothetical protein
VRAGSFTRLRKLVLKYAALGAQDLFPPFAISTSALS